MMRDWERHLLPRYEIFTFRTPLKVCLVIPMISLVGLVSAALPSQVSVGSFPEQRLVMGSMFIVCIIFHLTTFSNDGVHSYVIFATIFSVNHAFDSTTRLQAGLCLLQCLTWHSLLQYHSVWHLEHRFVAGWPHKAHFGGSLTSSSSISKLYVSAHILACFLISSADGEKKAFFWYFANFSHLPWLSFKSFSLISGTCSKIMSLFIAGGSMMDSCSRYRCRSIKLGIWSRRTSFIKPRSFNICSLL